MTPLVLRERGGRYAAEFPATDEQAN